MNKTDSRVRLFIPLFTALGVLIAGYVVLTVFKLMFASSFERITRGAVFEKYSDAYVMESEEYIAKFPRDKDQEGPALYLCRIGPTKYHRPVFSPYRLALSPYQDGQTLCEIDEFPVVYRVIDIYRVGSWGGVRNMALCVLCNVEGYEDIVFEKSLPNDSLMGDWRDPDGLIIQKEPFPDLAGSCQWTKERYEQVINSPRCKLRKEIIKHIAPGDRTKNVSGWLWNW